MGDPNSSEGELYDVAPERASAVPPPPSAPAPAVLRYQSPASAAVSAPADSYFPDKLKDSQFPLAMLIGGLVVEWIAAFWRFRGETDMALRAISQIGIDVVASTALMLPALFIAARFRHIDFGRFWAAVLKLSAISIAPSAVMTILDVPLSIIPFGFLIVWVAGFCFYFALIGAFFDLDQSDTWYCVLVIFLIKLGIYFAAMAIK